MSITRLFLKLFYNLAGCYSSAVKSPRRFMNLGFHSTKNHLKLKDADLKDESFIRLYSELVRNLNMEGKSVLEVGCGRGGGCYIFSEYLGAARIFGIDLSLANIKLANQLNVHKNITFNEGNATKFTFEKEKFDFIVNLESSHCYHSKEDFFNRVYTALQDNGTFAYADLINANKVEKTEAQLLGAGFTILQKREFTSSVVDSIEINSAKQSPFITKFPWLIPRFIKNINVVKGSDVHLKLQSKSVVYNCYTLVK
ncbi:MAG: SAM-dependent methyltransferase [Parvicellaceae bacterium]|jgi:SAM-dependent methyltransferase